MRLVGGLEELVVIAEKTLIPRRASLQLNLGHHPLPGLADDGT
jgi:hypothetical protein